MKGKGRLVIRIALVAVGAALLVLGFVTGQAQEVLRKAIYICLECVGIG